MCAEAESAAADASTTLTTLGRTACANAAMKIQIRRPSVMRLTTNGS
jgi:hypothetical protein